MSGHRIELALVLGLLSSTALATERQALATERQWESTSPSHQVQVVELYTSQGCHSCPPADAWLAQFESKDPDFTQVLPLAFHVTYWDALGWRDPFGQKSFDLRQRALARSQRMGVYTPGVFVNGQEWRRWRSGQSPAGESNAPGRLSFRGGEGAETEFRYEPTTAAKEKYVLHAAFLLPPQRTPVPRGENKGKELKESFVVSSLRSFSMDCAETCNVKAELEPSEDAGVIAAWVTTQDGEYLQATATYL